MGHGLSDAHVFVVNIEIYYRKATKDHIVVAVTINVKPGTLTFDEHETLMVIILPGSCKVLVMYLQRSEL